MVYQLCRPIWKRFMAEAVMAGALSITPAQFRADERNLSRVKWITPKWEWIDPLKDRQAEALAVRMGFKPRSDVQNAEGYDPEEVDAAITADNERADAADLILDSDPRRTTGAGQLQIQPGESQPQQGPEDGDSPTADDADPADLGDGPADEG
jgi:capsid protein